MARSWQEISELPQFQALDARGQERLRNEYFRYVIAPNLSIGDLDAARATFDEETAPRTERTWGEALSDTGIQLAEGGLNVLGAPVSLLAPDSEAAAGISGAGDWLRQQQSLVLRKRQAEADAAVQAAGEEGFGSQLAEALKQYSTPMLASRLVTTNLPTMIPGLGAGRLAQVGSLARSARAAGVAPGALNTLDEAAQVAAAQRALAAATTAGGVTNAALNAGGARQEAYDDLYRTLVQQGVDPQQAQEMAASGSVAPGLVGAATGYLSGRIGLEPALAGRSLGQGGWRAGLGAVGAELGGEQVEEVVPQAVTNLVASQYDQRPITQDLGQTVAQTLIGTLPGAGMAGGAAGFASRGTLSRAAAAGQAAEDKARREALVAENKAKREALDMAEKAAKLGVAVPSMYPTDPTGERALDDAWAERLGNRDPEAPSTASAYLRQLETQGTPLVGGHPDLAVQAAKVTPVEPVRGAPNAPRPDDDVWNAEPLEVTPIELPQGLKGADGVERPPGTYHTLVIPSQDGAWRLNVDIDPNGEPFNQEVWPAPQQAPVEDQPAQTDAPVPPAPSPVPDETAPQTVGEPAQGQGRLMDLASLGLPGPDAGLQTRAEGEGAPVLQGVAQTPPLKTQPPVVTPLALSTAQPEETAHGQDAMQGEGQNALPLAQPPAEVGGAVQPDPASSSAVPEADQPQPAQRTLQALRAGKYQTRLGTRTPAQQHRLQANGFRPVVLADDGVWEESPEQGIWAKPKTGEWEGLRRAPVNGEEVPEQTLSATDKAKKREQIQFLQDFIDNSPSDARVPQWQQRQAELRAEVGDPEPEAVAPTPGEPTPVDTTDWSAPRLAAKALLDEYTQNVAALAGNRRANGAFKRRVRSLAKKTPANDDHAVTILDILMTRLGADEKTPSLEFGPEVANPVSLAPTRGPDMAQASPETPMASPAPAIAPQATTEPVTAASPAWGANNTLVTRARAEELRKRAKAKLAQLNSGIDPEMLAIMTELAAFHLEAGARRFGDFARTMAQDLGVDVARLRPFLRSAYNGARDMMEDHGLDVTGIEDPETVRTALAKLFAPTTLESQPTTEETADDQPGTGEADQGGERQGGGGDLGAGRSDTKPDDRPLAGDSSPDGGGSGTAGDTGGVRPSAAGTPGGDGGQVSGGGDGLAGQPGAGQPGLADQRTGTRRRPARRRRAPDGDGGAGASAPEGEAGSGAVAPELSHADDLAARAENFHADDPLRIYGGTPKARFRKNRRAIELYRELEETGRAPTREEQEELAGYTGFGSFGQELFQGSWAHPVVKDGWAEENDWLRNFLGESEWRSAQASILNAHYTDPPTVQAMWAAVEKLGFKGGRVLEPAAGVGNFFALMPKAIQRASKLTGIELDELTSGILRQLYPEANIQQKGYQDSQTPDNFYDLVIGNWPFASTGPADRRYNALSPSLHDYFFLKALDQVRPGGLVVGITSRYTLDGKAAGVRQALARKADLVAAIRLPSGAFADYAGTAVVTDILILQKRAQENPQPSEVPWTQTQPQTFPGGNEAGINRYYREHPEQVLGTLAWGSGTTYGRAGVTVERPDNLAERLTAVMEKLPEGIYQPASNVKPVRYLTNNTQERQFAVTVGPDGGLYQIQGERLAALEDVIAYRVKDAKKTAAREAQLRALVGLRQAYGALIDGERDGAAGVEALRATLKGQYDAFVAAHGPVRKSAGMAILKRLEDPFYPSLMALERERDGVITPMPILERSVMRRPVRLDNPSVRDAYVLARNQGLALDMEVVARQAKVTPEAAAQELIAAGAVFRTPAGSYEPADVYLGGNVRRKLREAQAAAEQGEDMAHNIAELEKVIPPDVPYLNIEARLGAQWVAPRFYRDFVAQELLGNPDLAEGLELEWRINRWVVKPDEEARNLAAALRWRTIEARNAEGRIVDREIIPFRQLVEAAFNNGTMRFTYKDEEGNTVVREALSAAANEKAGAIREAFEEWIWKEPERKVALERDYNEVMNAIANPRFDGSFLAFEGMALQRGDNDFNLRSHQSNAIWRGLVQGAGLYAHEVGTGKAGSLDSLLLTPKGWLRMGDVKVGDTVITQSGEPTLVEAVFPQGEKDIFRVTFSDGSSTECCDEHLWLTQTYRERIATINEARLGRDWPSAKAKVRPLAEIRETLLAPHLGAKNHSIPIVEPVQFDAQQVPMDPYLLGALLGDGHFGRQKVSFTKTDRAMVDAFVVPDGVRLAERVNEAKCPAWDICGTENRSNPMLDIARGLGLAGKLSPEKFVPECYKLNSVEVRLAVLRGLMDTDGTVDKKGTAVSFCTVSERLADDVTFLVRSLGGITKRTMKTPRYTYKGEQREGLPAIILSVCMPPDINPFLLPRKADRVVPKTRYLPARYIVAVEPVGRKLAQCIRVAHESRLYVADDFIVTHNTYSMAGIAVESRRFGLAKKPLILAHNANSASVAAEIQEMYPGAKVLYVNNLQPKRVKETLAQIRNDDWDAVVMPHSLLDRLTLSEATLRAVAAEEIAALEAAFWDALREAAAEDANAVGYGQTEDTLDLDDPESVKKIRNATAKELANARLKILERIRRQAQEASRADAVTFEDLGVDMLMVDECFTHDTLVETDQGLLKIGDIVEQRLSVQVKAVDSSTHAVQWKPVVNWYANPLRAHLIEVFHESGSFVCTPNHKIWVSGHGYKLAGELGPTDRLVISGTGHQSSGDQARQKGGAGYSAMRVVQDGVFVSETQESEFLLRVLQNAGATGQPSIGTEVPAGHAGNLGKLPIEGENQPGVVATDDAQQSHAKTGNPGTHDANPEGQRAPSEDSRRERATADATATVVGRLDRDGHGIRHQDAGHLANDGAPATPLQGGPGGPRADAGGGDRREQSPVAQGQGARRQKGEGIVASRVVGVAILERGSDGEYRFCGRTHSVVYDIEVADNHNYFANGVLVSNCHLFKKPPMATRMKMRGLQKQLSNRSVALKFLTDYIKNQNGGRGVHLFTGTPITNTLAEIFHMQRYVMHGEMKRDGIGDWDSWFNTFATGVSDMEFTAAGDYQPVTKLAGFINVAELRRMMSPYMDVVFADDMPEFTPRQTPSGKTMAAADLTEAEREHLLNGWEDNPVGRPYRKVIMDVAEMSPEQQAIMAYLQDLAAEWRRADGRTRRDWMQAGDPHSPIMVEGAAARAGMDARMEDLSLPDYPASKVNRAVRNIMRHYQDEPLAGQVVFMDKGYSDTRTVRGERVPGLNLAKELREKLIAAGIPSGEIAIVAGGVTPEQKKAVADAVNSGKVRVVIGQTETLGTGVNMQQRLRAMHHLDAPWMPGELEQRNGRGWRQGNSWNTVLEYRYITERIDGKRWQVLAVKDRFIKAFLKADAETRVIEGDAVSDEEGGYAETLSEAVGDPRLLQRQKLRADLEKLNRRERTHTQGMVEAREKLARNKRSIPKKTAEIATYRGDAALFAEAEAEAGRAQQADYRARLDRYVQSLGLDLTAAQRAAVVADGWGPKQPDKELAKRVRAAVLRAEEEGRARPTEPTTQPFAGHLLNDRLTTREEMTTALTSLWQRMPQDQAGWVPVGDIFGFRLEARRSGRVDGELRLVSGTDDQHDYWLYSRNAGSIVNEYLRGFKKQAAKLQREIVALQRDQDKLAELAKQPFARAEELARKQARLAEIEADMALNPVPAPAWLRHGAPLDSQAFWKGKPVVVEGHQWADDGYFVHLLDGEKSRRVPYLEVQDANGAAVYEPHEFTAPVVREAEAENPAPAEPRRRAAGEVVDIAAEEAEGPAFSKTTASGPGGSVTAITQAVRRLVRHWANAPRFVVFRGMDDSQVDAAVRKAYQEESARRRAEDPKAKPDLVEGFYFRGQVYINAEAVRDVADLERVLRHETLGHAGLRGLFGGPELDTLLDRLARARRAEVAAMASERGLDMEDQTQRRLAAEEVLAELAQWHPELGWVRQLVALIKAKLRKWGVLDAGKLSNAEILREYVIPARNFIERGRMADRDIPLRSRVAPVFSVRATDPSGKPRPGDVVLVDGQEAFGHIPVEIAEDAKQQSGAQLVTAPIKLFRGKHEGKHRGYGLTHIEAEHGAEIRQLGLQPEAFLLKVLDEANQIWESGDRLVLAKTGRNQKAMVIELIKDAGHYTVVTAYPVSGRHKTFGKLVWRGRAHGRFTGSRASGLDSQRAPLIDQQLTNPPEPLGGNNTLHPLLDTLRGQPVDTSIEPVDNKGNPDVRFSLARAADAGAAASIGPARTMMTALKQAWADRWTQALPQTLGALTLRQLAQVGADWLPLLPAYDRLRTRMDTRRNVMMEEAGKLGDAVDSWARRHKDEARAAFELMNDATAAQVDPSDFKPLMVPLQLGPGREFLRNWAATEANVQELKSRIRVWKKSADYRERALAAYYAQAARILARAVRGEKKRLAAAGDLIARWNALSSGARHLGPDGKPFATEQAARTALQARTWPKGQVVVIEEVDGGWALQELGGQQVFTRFRDLYQKRSGEMLEALIARIDSLASLSEDDKRALAARIRREFESPVDELGNPRVGPYFPFQRFGKWYLFGRKLPGNEARTWVRNNGEPFASEAAAWTALRKRRDLEGVNARPMALEDGTGWELREVGEEGFWLFESVAERRAAVAGLKAEGWEIRGQGLTAEAHRELEGVSEGFIADAVTKLKAQGSTEEADTLYQMYLQTLQQMSIRKHFIHRKGTKGYTADQLRAFGYNMTRLANQISKLELMPGMESTLRQMEEGIKESRADKPDGDVSKENALLGEVKKRHEFIANPTNAPWTNVVSALNFLFYLGLTPGAALVNLSQVPIVALPVLAARVRTWAGGGAGGWGTASKALTRAAGDVARGFNPEVIKGFLTGRPLPSAAAHLTAEERDAFARWEASGARDRTQAHNLAGIGDTDSWTNGPVFNRVMAAVSGLFHAAEVLNRDATLLAGYRLARASGLDHDDAVRQSEEATWDAHFDYSNQNRARFMQSDVAKVLLQFKNYAQHVLYFLGRNLFLWAKGQSPEVRREARTRFAGMLGMTAVFAGTAGLPLGGAFFLANVINALFGDDDEPWDAETEWQRLLERTFPATVAGVIERGAVNRLTGLDMSSRVSLAELLWRAPDRDLDGAGLYQHVVEQLLGPTGGLLARPFTLADNLAEGEWSRAAEGISPKFLKDVIQAGRFAREGVMSRKGDEILPREDLSSWELLWKALGMQPDALQDRYERNAAVKLYEKRIVDRRRVLLTGAALAMIHQDREMLAAARAKIAQFNQANPEYKIANSSIRRSVKAREQMRERARAGILVNPKLGYLYERAGGYAQQPGAD